MTIKADALLTQLTVSEFIKQNRTMYDTLIEFKNEIEIGIATLPKNQVSNMKTLNFFIQVRSELDTELQDVKADTLLTVSEFN